jgi:hypothetical protein
LTVREQTIRHAATTCCGSLKPNPAAIRRAGNFSVDCTVCRMHHIGCATTIVQNVSDNSAIAVGYKSRCIQSSSPLYFRIVPPRPESVGCRSLPAARSKQGTRRVNLHPLVQPTIFKKEAVHLSSAGGFERAFCVYAREDSRRPWTLGY